MSFKRNGKTVILGLSGGVDSAVCAFLLLQQGYEVIPIFMQNWDTVANNDVKGHTKKIVDGCESNIDYEDAKKVAEYLNLKLHKVDFIDQYWNNVFKDFIDKYKKSLTPNPDVLCNKFIKFGSFYDYVKQNFKFDYIAMGHYVGIKQTQDGIYLLKALDDSKDQSYFLCDLNQDQLKQVMFPLANLIKKEVREIAKQNNLPVWNKKDSTGICFIGKRDFNEFLGNYIPALSGNIVDIETKKIVGKHIGTMYYTLGQNKDLHLSGQKEKYFVCDKDVNKRILYVCTQDNKQKYLQSTKCTLESFNFINSHSLNDLTNLKVRFRHLQKLIDIKSIQLLNDLWTLEYSPTLAVTPGQYAVIYKDNVCIGGGVIKSIIKN